MLKQVSSVAMSFPFSETSTKYEECDKYTCDYLGNKETYAHKNLQILKSAASYTPVLFTSYLNRGMDLFFNFCSELDSCMGLDPCLTRTQKFQTNLYCNIR